MEASSSHLSWARSLDFVLSDRPALDAFREWLEENSSPQYLKLHFAMKAYERMVLEKNPKKNELGREIYVTFLSSRTGCCELIPPKIRIPIGEKIRAMNSVDLDSRIFSVCFDFVDDFLRRQHQQFVSSDEFLDAFNKISINEPTLNTIERKKSSNWRRNATQLTAETLLKSRKDRQTTLGETKLEKMYPPTRQPYVCNATTSHNDSAVSSSFSNDAPSSTHRGTKMRQARENPVTFTLPRVENSHRTEGQQFDHSTEYGRKQFVNAVTNKMMRILDKIKLNDDTEKKINDIEQCKYTTLDMVYGTNADEDMGRIDEEEDIDVYLKRMKDESQRASANRSPQQINDPTFSPPREVQSTSSSSRNIEIDRMTQSMCTYPYRSGGAANMEMFANHSNKISLDTFAPPPTKSSHAFNNTPHFTTMSRSSRDTGSQMYDSSGIGSMAPSAFSASSGGSSRKSREHHHHHHHRLPPNYSSQHHNSSNFGTAPRKHKSKQQNMSNLITISYVGFDGVPVVAHVPNNGPMTLAEFRQCFLLNNAQLFFKTECEDGSAPYQLLLITNDNHILPIFEGRISAEMR